MCVLGVALFSLQKEGFSCRDAHAFNRRSHGQRIANTARNASGKKIQNIFAQLFAFSSPLRAWADALSLGKRCRNRASYAC